MTAILLPRRSISRSLRALMKAGERAISSAFSRMLAAPQPTTRRLARLARCAPNFFLYRCAFPLPPVFHLV